MNATMSEERARDSHRKRALARSVLSTIEAAEACIEGSGVMEIRSSRLPRGVHVTMMERDPETGQVGYSRQDAEAERVMARLLYTKLSKAVSEPADVAHVIVSDTRTERRPEYLVPKMVHVVQGWALYPEDTGGFYRRKLRPAEVEEISPRYRYVVEAGPDGPEIQSRPAAGDEPDEIFEEFMALTQWTFDEPPRKLTHDEKLEIWERRRLLEEDLEGPQYVPDDEVRYF